MKTMVFLNVEGRRHFVGLLSSDARKIAFEYADAFLQTGLQISPIAVPLGRGVRMMDREPFNGLPGFAADSLPDGWGNLLLSRQLKSKGRRLEEIDPLQRLCWVGSQGMGAMEYEPEEAFSEEFQVNDIRLDVLADTAGDILADIESGSEIDSLMTLNGSSGGARPKIVCLVTSDHKQLRQGTMIEDGANPWIIKFRSSADAAVSGAMEYAVSLLAKSVGIDMPETHLFPSKRCPGWFGIRRFDRNEKGKLHMATAAGLLHCNFRYPCLDYSSLMQLALRLAGAPALVQMLKRAYFNFVIDNRDDHAKNFSFLMNARGEWSLAPAYDLVPSCGSWEHMTAIAGCGKAPARKLFVKLGEDFLMPKRKIAEALEEVDDSLAAWPHIARDAGLKDFPKFEPIR